MWRQVKRIGCRALMVVGFVLARTEVAAQGCAMCRTALGSADDPLANGFFWSIMFLGSAPFVVVGSVGGWLLYRHHATSSRDTHDEKAGGEPGGTLP